MKMLVPPTFTVAAVATTRSGERLPVPDEAKPALARARHDMALYGRHFAGKPRATRDPDLLGEIVARLEDTREDLLGVAPTRPVVMAPTIQDLSQQLALLTFEQAQMRTATAGFPPDQRAVCLAVRIDEAILTYRTHVEQRSRLSRRPGLLRRLHRTFERIGDELAAPELTGGAEAANVEKNRALVASIVAHLAVEAPAVVEAHARAAPEERRTELELAGQDEIDLYTTRFASAERATWDRAVYAGCCERLHEVEIGLHELGRGGVDVATPLRVVSTALDAFEIVWGELVVPTEPPG